jgi:hypothetical protein
VPEEQLVAVRDAELREQQLANALAAIAGWFVFEEMIVAAVAAILLGTASWLSHRKRKNKERNKAAKLF